MDADTRSPTEHEPRTLLLAVLAAGVLMRFILAASLGLGVDESYAVAVARQWSLSYFDHPPLHFWIAGGIAKLAHSEKGAVVRLPFVLCFIGTTWFTFRLGRRFFGDRAGAIAALLLNVSAVFSLSTGGWVLPDGPLMLAMVASANVVVSVLFDETPSLPTARWLLAGALAGLAMLAKYHGIFVLGGTFLFLATSAQHRKWLRHPGPYLGAAVAFAMFAPVILWNREHGWVSFAFQGARAAGTGGLHIGALLTNIAGQAAWVLPWIWIPLVATLVRSLRAGPRDARRWFLFCLAVGPIATFTLIALRGDVGLPHWQAPGYLMLFPALGASVAARLESGDVRVRRWLRGSVWAFVLLVALLGSHTATGWLGAVMPGAFTRGDPSSDAIDWSELRPALEARGLLPVDGFVAAPSWIQAGKAAVGLGPDVPVICLCADPHHFFYLRDDRAYLGANALIVKREKPGDDVVSAFSPYFESVEAAGVVPIHRGGREALRVGIWKARGFRRAYPTEQPR